MNNADFEIQWKMLDDANGIPKDPKQLALVFYKLGKSANEKRACDLWDEECEACQ